MLADVTGGVSGFDAGAFESLKAYVGFDASSAATLRELYPVVIPNAPAIVDDFYAAIEAHPEARQVITGGKAQIARLKHTLGAWLESVLKGPHDAEYLAAHARIGRVHVRIALPQKFMFSAMNRIRAGLLEIVYHGYPADRALQAARAINAILDLELAIMLETYRESSADKVRSSERLATIGQLAATIGHELRNPLGIVESSLFLIRQRLTALGVQDGHIDKHRDRIVGQIRLCNKTITNLLDLARDRPPAPRRLVLSSLLEHAVEQSGVRPATEVVVQVPEALGIDVDPDDFMHVLVNLLLNASHAQNGTGRVVVRAACSKGGVELTVADDGPGVPPEIRGRIFDALFTTKARGTGLGLALCQRIIQAHGGEISLEPTTQGARFRIWFPHRAPSTTEREP